MKAQVFEQQHLAGRQGLRQRLGVGTHAIRGQALNNAYQVSVDTMRGEKLNKTWADSRVPTAVTATGTSDGFSWSDAGIGAAVTLGAVLFLLTAVGLGRRHRGRIDGSGLARA